MSVPKNIVLVGGGYANLSLATLLEKSLAKIQGYNIILISSRDYYYHLTAGLRANTSDEKIAEDICIKLDKVFKNVNLSKTIHGTVTEVKSNSVLLADGQEIDFAYLVLGTGKIWLPPSDAPDNRQEAIQQMKKYRDKVKNANDIIIVGGGAVGVEIAGEIATSYPKGSGKNVTVIHSAPKLVNDTYNDKFRNSLEKQARDLGINFVLGDKLSGEYDFTSGPQEVTTQNGQNLRADLIITATGGKVNDGPLKNLVPNLLSAKGVKVKPTFQLEGHDDIFAIGDLADLPEQKQAVKTPGHAAVVNTNIVASIKGQPLKDYKGSVPAEMIIVNLGNVGGAGYVELPLIGASVFGGWLSKTLKGKSLFIQEARAMVGY